MTEKTKVEEAKGAAESTKTEILSAENVTVHWYGYVALVLAILFFSGIFKDAQGPIKALDFTNVLGSFGKLGEVTEEAGTLANDFRGTGGSGGKDAWMFALTLFPAVMLALGVVKVVEYFDGLKAAQKLLTPILRPLLGIPGICGLTLIAALQSTDAGASMTNELRETNAITEKEKTIFACFQYSAGATITNYLSSCAALFAFFTTSIVVPLIVVFVFKIIGANVCRFYLNRIYKGEF